MDSPSHNSFPAPNPAPSIVSSRMTDIVSEDGDEYYPEGAATASAQQRARGVSTTNSSRPASPPHSTYSRRAVMNRRGGHPFTGPGLSMTNTSRPQSSYSRTSMTHVPSITSQAFFRPMSSQRLQAQRGTRPATATTTEEMPRLSTSTANRPSMESSATTTPKRQDAVGPPPSSRGTDFTADLDPRDRALYNASPTGNNTIQSTGDSTRPLQTSESNQQRYEDASQRDVISPRTPASFRSNFKRSSKAPPPLVQTELPRNDRLSTDTNSPHLVEKSSPRLKPRTGKNYEYFSGNTAFCWGGRLQNTRDRPVNIATGALVVLPTVLFFIFSYVHINPASVAPLTNLSRAPYLWHNVSPAIPIVFAYLFFICMSSFLHASVTDPGVRITPSKQDEGLSMFY